MASALATATSLLRVGTLMLLNDLRHPAILAKEAAALDVLSEGRLELGIGAGWKDTDYTSIGLCMPKGPVRVQRLRESIAVVKGLFADGPFNPDRSLGHAEPYRCVIGVLPSGTNAQLQ